MSIKYLKFDAKRISTFASALAVAGSSQYAEGGIVVVNAPAAVNWSSTAVNRTFTWVDNAVTKNFQIIQWNDTEGKSMEAAGGLKMALFSQSAAITNVEFGGVSASSNQTGSQLIGFKTSAGELGWFSVNWGGTGGAVTYGDGYINTTVGEQILAGTNSSGLTSTVPEPTSAAAVGLAGLALGAVNLRRRRAKRAA